MVYGIKSNKVLMNQTTAGTGTTFPLDVRYDLSPMRAVHGTVTTGDSVTIQGTTWDRRGPDKTNLASATFHNLGTYTANFTDILNGPWTYIRIVKTGTAGNATVYGMI